MVLDRQDWSALPHPYFTIKKRPQYPLKRRCGVERDSLKAVKNKEIPGQESQHNSSIIMLKISEVL
jgi:hypothetical protein